MTAFYTELNSTVHIWDKWPRTVAVPISSSLLVMATTEHLHFTKVHSVQRDWSASALSLVSNLIGVPAKYYLVCSLQPHFRSPPPFLRITYRHFCTSMSKILSTQLEPRARGVSSSALMHDPQMTTIPLMIGKALKCERLGKSLRCN